MLERRQSLPASPGTAMIETISPWRASIGFQRQESPVRSGRVPAGRRLDAVAAGLHLGFRPTGAAAGEHRVGDLFGGLEPGDANVEAIARGCR